MEQICVPFLKYIADSNPEQVDNIDSFIDFLAEFPAGESVLELIDYA